MIKERFIEHCPLCGKKSVPKYHVDCRDAPDYNPNFGHVRTWKYCPDCHHMHAGELPVDLEGAVKGYIDAQYTTIKPPLFGLYSDIINGIVKYANIGRVLDVGFGAGELLLVCNEFGSECHGVEIRDEYRELVGGYLPDAKLVATLGEVEDEVYDVVFLGDVLEHVADPKGVLSQVRDKLAPCGMLWISTPNFDSAFATMAGRRDPMMKVVEHVNWFSHKSLRKLLEETGFTPFDYRVSKHFNGCMEVIATVL